MSEPFEPTAPPAAETPSLPPVPQSVPPETPAGTPPAARWTRPVLVAVAVLALVAIFWPHSDGARGRRPGGFLATSK